MPNSSRFIKKALESKFEDEKNVAYIRGFKAGVVITRVMRDIYLLKKPIGVPLNKRNLIRPFEDSSPIEFICQKNDCSLFIFTSSNKKRPNSLIMGRLFDGRILDMVEFGVENYKSIEDFPARISLGVKPILIFAGEPFETDFDLMRIKNVLTDIFAGPRPTNIRIKGIEHVILFVAQNGTIHMRPYLIKQEKVGNTVAATCHAMGPMIDLVPKRTQLADKEHHDKACKQMNKKGKQSKKIVKDELGSTRGRIHVNRQDFKKMYSVKH